MSTLKKVTDLKKGDVFRYNGDLCEVEKIEQSRHVYVIDEDTGEYENLYNVDVFIVPGNMPTWFQFMESHRVWVVDRDAIPAPEPTTAPEPEKVDHGQVVSYRQDSWHDIAVYEDGYEEIAWTTCDTY